MEAVKDNRFYSLLFKLGLPIALQNLISFSISLSDTVMLGRLGENVITGAYMGNQIQLILQIFSVGVEGAILAISAQHWGRRNNESIKKTVAVGTAFLVVIGALITLICITAPRPVISLFTSDSDIIATGSGYLKILSLSFIPFCITQALVASMRSVESTKIGSYASVAAFAINLILDYALIFGNFGFPRLSVNGAAIATLSARIVELSIMVIYVLFIDKKLGLSLKSFFVFDKAIIRDFISHGSPIILGQLVWVVNTLSASMIIGRTGNTNATAALSIANTLNTLAYVLTNGISAALGIIIGKSVGESDYERVKQYTMKAQRLFILFGAATFIIISLAKIPFISIYNVGIDTERTTSAFINVLAITALATPYQSACLFGLLKSGGDMKFVFKVESLAVFAAVIPSALLAARLGAPAWVIFAALKCDQPLKCIPAAIRVNRFKWIKNIAVRN